MPRHASLLPPPGWVLPGLPRPAVLFPSRFKSVANLWELHINRPIRLEQSERGWQAGRGGARCRRATSAPLPDEGCPGRLPPPRHRPARPSRASSLARPRPAALYTLVVIFRLHLFEIPPNLCPDHYHLIPGAPYPPPPPWGPRGLICKGPAYLRDRLGACPTTSHLFRLFCRDKPSASRAPFLPLLSPPSAARTEPISQFQF